MSEREMAARDPDQDADPRVLALLERGAPANSVDLAPWWRTNAAQLTAAPKPRPRLAQPWMAYAAVFVVGIGLGLMGGDKGRAGSPATHAQVCRYTDAERKALTAVLDASATLNGADWSPRRVAMVSLCSSCHVGPVKDDADAGSSLLKAAAEARRSAKTL